MPKNFVGSFSEHCEKQFLLVSKTGIEGGLGSLSASGDFGGAGSLVTFFHEDFGGHLKELICTQLFFLFGWQPAGFRSGHRAEAKVAKRSGLQEEARSLTGRWP